MKTNYIFVTGGVVSSLGKGIISASIGKLLQARGYKVTPDKPSFIFFPIQLFLKLELYSNSSTIV